MRTVLAVVGGSLLISLFGPISLRLPFTPVPVVVQPHICLFLGALLGSRRGAAAVLLFLLQGIAGLPVFSLGRSGLMHMFSPTGGYLVGYLFAAWMTGYILERVRSPSPKIAALAMSVGNLVIYAFGLPHLAMFVGVKPAFLLGMLPFLVGDLVKLILAYQALRPFRFGHHRS
jgi:biotin transport system substrate-specific component